MRRKRERSSNFSHLKSTALEYKNVAANTDGRDVTNDRYEIIIDKKI